MVEGYYELEKQERNQRLHALGQHTDAVALWYRALTLFRLAMVGEWTIEGEATAAGLAGEGLQMRLLGLSVTSMKSALEPALEATTATSPFVTRHACSRPSSVRLRPLRGPTRPGGGVRSRAA
ncbi:MAG: hypothetical protein R2853_21120 [Thermomicrobiales bacterium]